MVCMSTVLKMNLTNIVWAVCNMVSLIFVVPCCYDHWPFRHIPPRLLKTMFLSNSDIG